MDPQACLSRLLAAVSDNDTEEAICAAEDLLNWLDRGGAAPPVTRQDRFSLFDLTQTLRTDRDGQKTVADLIGRLFPPHL